jgi:hypothetical protein
MTLQRRQNYSNDKEWLPATGVKRRYSYKEKE